MDYTVVAQYNSDQLDTVYCIFAVHNQRMDLNEDFTSHTWLPLIDISMEMNWGHPIPGKVASAGFSRREPLTGKIHVCLLIFQVFFNNE